MDFVTLKNVNTPTFLGIPQLLSYWMDPCGLPTIDLDSTCDPPKRRDIDCIIANFYRTTAIIVYIYMDFQYTAMKI